MFLKGKKKFALGVLVAASFFQAMPIQALTLYYDGKAHTYNLPTIKLFVNGSQVTTRVMDPVQIDNRVLVPAREVFESMGATVDWQAALQQVSIHHKGNELILKVNQTTAIYNGEEVTMDVPAKVINEKIMIPIRFISETLGFKVQWVASEYAVYVDERQNVVTETLEKPVDNIPETLYPIGANVYLSYANQPNAVFTANTQAKARVEATSLMETDKIVTFKIVANSAMSQANLSVLQDKIVIDIENSTNGLAGAITPITNTYVKSIRTSQYKETTTRVVLDLKSGAHVTASFSQDRKQILVYLKKQSLEEAAINYTTSGEELYLKGIYASQVQIVESPETKQLVVTIPNTYITESFAFEQLNGQYITSAVFNQYGNDVVCVLDYKEDMSYQLVDGEKGVTLKVTKPRHKFFTYTSTPQLRLVLPKPEGFALSQVKVQDLYREKKLVFSLGANYSTYFENDVFLIEDGKVNSVAASSTLYETTLTIETQTIFTYDLTETEDEMIITLLRPREKYDKIVVLDAGHGGTDNGASGNGLKEKVVNLNHAMAVYNLLQADSTIKVYMTRESDTYPTLQDRANLANEIDAHLFISIHNNSATSTAKGTETLYHPNSAKGKEMATILQQNLVNHLGTTNRGIKARTDLYVLKNTNMPAVLIEGAFLTNQEDAARMNTPTFIAEYGKAVYESILYFLE